MPTYERIVRDGNGGGRRYVGEGVGVAVERHEKRVEEAPGDSVVSGAFIDLGEGLRVERVGMSRDRLYI
jgi:hypothetical protein